MAHSHFFFHSNSLLKVNVYFPSLTFYDTTEDIPKKVRIPLSESPESPDGPRTTLDPSCVWLKMEWSVVHALNCFHGLDSCDAYSCEWSCMAGTRDGSKVDIGPRGRPPALNRLTAVETGWM